MVLMSVGVCRGDLEAVCNSSYIREERAFYHEGAGRSLTSGYWVPTLEISSSQMAVNSLFSLV